MAGEQTKTTLSDGMKLFYLPTLRDQINLKTSPLYAKIKKEAYSGKTIQQPIKYGVSGGVSAAAETATFPVAGGVSVKQFTGDSKNMYGVIQITSKLIKSTRDSRGAFKSAMTLEMERITETLRKNVDRQLFGDGTGVITTTNGTGSGATALIVADSTKLEIGMIIDVIDTDGTTVEIDAKRITNIVRSTHTCTLDDASTWGTGSYVCLQDSYNNELTGLGYLFNTTNTYWGLARTAYGFLIPTISNVNGVIDELDIQNGIDDASEYHGTDIDFIITSRGVRNSIMQLLKTYVQNLQVMKLQGGFTSIKYNDIDIYNDKNVGSGIAYMLDSKTFTEYNLGDWDWAAGDNGSVLRMLSTSPVMQGVLEKYADVLCYNPGGQTKLYGITENDGIA